MKRYTAAQARQHLSDVLDAAAAGESVIIERRGVRYTVTAARTQKKSGRRGSVIDILDPAVAAGQWTWTPAPGGVRFSPRKRARR
jgi:antitoxin (DNA-binding transcriptional repressor) of toxin-antitoxin stability system